MRWTALILVMLAGCGPSVPVSEPIDTGSGVGLSDSSSTSGLVERTPDTCRLEEFEGFVGQPASVLDTLPTTRPVRLVPPGAIVTNEYNPQRVNVDVNASNMIVGVRCG